MTTEYRRREGWTMMVMGIGGWHYICDTCNKEYVGYATEQEAIEEKERHYPNLPCFWKQPEER